MEREIDRSITAPPMGVVRTEQFQWGLRTAFRGLPRVVSRRVIRVDAQMRILGFKGKIYLSNGYPYPRKDVDGVLGEPDGRQISMFMELNADGTPRYTPSNATLVRLQALYVYIDICWPYIAKMIIR